MKSDFDQRKSHDDGDTLPEQANVYVPPRPLAQLSDHRTIDVKAIRIAAELDPRQAKTQLRIQAPVRHRRGLPLFVVGSAVVLALFGVALYMELTREQELPLVTTVTAPPALVPAPDPGTRSSVSPTQVGSNTATAPTGTLPPTSAPTEPASAAVAPGAPAAVSAPRSKAGVRVPRKAKITREPWLE